MTYRVGVIGSSFGGNVHVPAYKLHPKFEVVAIASPTNAAEVAKQRDIPHAFTSLEAMLASVEVDVVSIASPPFAHHRQTIAALASGKHVLCEKPFALTVAQAEEMVAAAKIAGTATAVAHEFRYNPVRRAIKELIVNGHLGTLRQIEVTAFATWLGAEVERPRGWWFERERGGGIAGAIGSHLIDSASWLAGRKPLRATGGIRTAIPERHDAEGPFTSMVDDGAFAIIDYGEGLIARVSVDGTMLIDSSTVAVHGDRRAAIGNGESLVESRLFLLEPDEQSELEVVAPTYARYEPVHGNIPMFLELLDDFAAEIETKTSTVPSFAESLETMRVLAAIGYATEA